MESAGKGVNKLNLMAVPDGYPVTSQTTRPVSIPDAGRFFIDPYQSEENTLNKVPLTLRGAEKLREELNHLKSVMRPRIIEAIAEARAHGDLKENAEYHAAREQQSFTEGRINEIEAKLSNAQVIDIASLNPGDKVVFGATVELADVETEETVTYQIVGDDEADIKAGLISISSPIARALIGKRVGDVASVNAPGGVREYDICAVQYI